MMMLAVMMMFLAMGCSKDSDDGPKDSELEKLAIGTWMCVECTGEPTPLCTYDE